MGRFSDFERKVDEMAYLSEFERKVAQTWLLTLAPVIAVTWWIDGLPLQRNYCWYPAGYGGEFCTTRRFLSVPYAREEWRFSNLTPTIQIALVAVGALLMVLAYRRIWKRPDEA